MNTQHLISQNDKTLVIDLTEKMNSLEIDNVNYVVDEVEKIVDELNVSYLLTTSNEFLRTQDGNFLIL